MLYEMTNGNELKAFYLNIKMCTKNNPLFLQAILYCYRADNPWRDLIERFGNSRITHTRHIRWSHKGVWQKVFELLTEYADNKYGMIDATIVKAHHHRAGVKNW